MSEFTRDEFAAERRAAIIEALSWWEDSDGRWGYEKAAEVLAAHEAEWCGVPEQRIAEREAAAWRAGAAAGHHSPLTWYALRQCNPFRAALARPTLRTARDPELSPSRNNCDGCINAAFDVGTTDRPLRPDGHDVACAIAPARPTGGGVA